MRYLFFLSFISAAFSSCSSKMTPDNSNDYALIAKRSFSDEKINQLKATTTVFFYKKDSQAQIDSLKQALSSGWDLTPMIFDDIDNFSRYAGDPKYSYFTIEGVTSSNSSYSNTHYYLTLRVLRNVTGRGKIVTDGLCRIDLYPNFETMRKGQMGGKANTVINKLYNSGVFYNWNPILLKAEIGAVSTNLKNNKKPGAYQNLKTDDFSQLIFKDTLYVPQRLLMDFGAFTGKEKEKKENIFKNYKYKYRICSDEELFKIFQVEKRGRLLFEYVKSSTDKFITVYDLRDRKVIYKVYSPVSYNVTAKDIEGLEYEALKYR